MMNRVNLEKLNPFNLKNQYHGGGTPKATAKKEHDSSSETPDVNGVSSPDVEGNLGHKTSPPKNGSGRDFTSPMHNFEGEKDSSFRTPTVVIMANKPADSDTISEKVDRIYLEYTTLLKNLKKLIILYKEQHQAMKQLSSKKFDTAKIFDEMFANSPLSSAVARGSPSAPLSRDFFPDNVFECLSGNENRIGTDSSEINSSKTNPLIAAENTKREVGNAISHEPYDGNELDEKTFKAPSDSHGQKEMLIHTVDNLPADPPSGNYPIDEVDCGIPDSLTGAVKTFSEECSQLGGNVNVFIDGEKDNAIGVGEADPNVRKGGSTCIVSDEGDISLNSVNSKSECSGDKDPSGEKISSASKHIGEMTNTTNEVDEEATAQNHQDKCVVPSSHVKSKIEHSGEKDPTGEKEFSYSKHYSEVISPAIKIEKEVTEEVASNCIVRDDHIGTPLLTDVELNSECSSKKDPSGEIEVPIAVDLSKSTANVDQEELRLEEKSYIVKNDDQIVALLHNSESKLTCSGEKEPTGEKEVSFSVDFCESTGPMAKVDQEPIGQKDTTRIVKDDNSCVASPSNADSKAVCAVNKDPTGERKEAVAVDFCESTGPTTKVDKEPTAAKELMPKSVSYCNSKDAELNAEEMPSSVTPENYSKENDLEPEIAMKDLSESNESTERSIPLDVDRDHAYINGTKISYFDVLEIAHTETHKCLDQHGNLIKYLEDWERTIFQRVHGLYSEYMKHRKNLQHYIKKVDSLRNEVKHLEERQKQIAPKKWEKVERNEMKLSGARETHDNSGESLYLFLDEIVHRSWRDVFPLLHRTMQFENEYATQQETLFKRLRGTLALLDICCRNEALSMSSRLNSLRDLHPEVIYTGSK